MQQPISLFELDSVKGFLARIRRELAMKRHVAALVPKHVDCKRFCSALEDTLRDFDCTSIDVNALPSERAPLASICEVLRIPAPADPWSMRDAFANASGAPDVLLWRGLQNLGDDVVSPWLDLLRDRDIVGRLASGTAFCAVLPGPLAVQAAPEPDVGLAVVWWWGFPVIGELGQVRRSLSEPRNALIDDWKDAVLPPFAGDNAVLLEELYSLPELELSDIVAHLKSWALRNEWTPEFLTRCGALHIFEWSPASEGGDAPPLAFRNLWCCGALQVCSATGPALHPAALAVLGQNARLSSIVLRAQSTLVLPMLEEARLAICTVLTRRYGPRWVLLREPADAVEAAEVAADPLRCQWGHLRSVLWAPELVDHRTLLGVADEAWAIRNSLAHLRPITFARFEQFHNQIIRAWSLLPPQRTNRRTATISGVSRGVSAADGR